MKRLNKKINLALLIILAIFLFHAVSLNFIQDDAFISYRYVKNFVNGKGLVFNFGERVEGYTNFLWIILLALLTGLGINTILASKILGLASGCLSLLLLYRISLIFLREDEPRGARQGRNGGKVAWLALTPSLLMAANGAFAYWCISGLESGLFVMLILASTYFFFTRERFMILFSALATLARPEGVLVFAIFILHKLFFKKDGLKNGLLSVAAYTVLLLPYLVFKLFYYGNLLPNPFYAKAGISWEYLRSGLDYFWRFQRHYGFWGLLYLISLTGLRRTSRAHWLACLMIWVYSLAVIVIGGDVLQGHRFFLPVLPFLYLFVGMGLRKLHSAIVSGPWRQGITVAVVAILLSLTFLLPRSWLIMVRRAEIGFVLKMTERARMITHAFGDDIILAATTIGAISYYSGATVIDMLGLTDPYIARHPEDIPGIVSPWKEKRFNSRYLLSRDPDVILFSTGMKPSAPAERTLFLYSKFRNNYYQYYFPKDNLLPVVFRRKGDYPYKNHLFPDYRFVDMYHEALTLASRKRFDAAVKTFEELFRIAPPDFSWAHDHMAFLQFEMGHIEKSREYAQRAIEIDPYCALSHLILQKIYTHDGDTLAAGRERQEIQRINPELLAM